MRILNEWRSLPWNWMAIVFAIAVVVVGDPSSSINGFVYRWQTGIAAGIAAFAAYKTIRKMQEIDQQAQRRHEEIAAIQLKPDRLRLELASAAFSEALRFIRPVMEQRTQMMGDYLTAMLQARQQNAMAPDGLLLADIHLENARKTAEKILADVSHLMSVVDGEPFQNALALFGPRLRVRLSDLSESQLVEVDFFRFPHLDNPWVTTPFLFEFQKRDATEILNALDSFQRRFQLFIRQAEDFRHALARLCAAYPALIDEEGLAL